jgi:hypothetical protein
MGVAATISFRLVREKWDGTYTTTSDQSLPLIDEGGTTRAPATTPPPISAVERRRTSLS